MISQEAMVKLAEGVCDNVNALNHAAYSVTPAPLVYDLTGNLKVAAWGLAQLCDQMDAGLQRSLDEFDVYDRNRDPAESVDLAGKQLAIARDAIKVYADAIGKAQVAINLQGYNGPKPPPAPEAPGTPGGDLHVVPTEGESDHG